LGNSFDHQGLRACLITTSITPLQFPHNSLFYLGFNAKKNEMGFYDRVNCYSSPLLVVFQPLLAAPSARVFYTLSYSSHNQLLAKRESNLGSPRFEPMTKLMSNQCTTTQPNHVS